MKELQLVQQGGGFYVMEVEKEKREKFEKEEKVKY